MLINKNLDFLLIVQVFHLFTNIKQVIFDIFKHAHLSHDKLS